MSVRRFYILFSILLLSIFAKGQDRKFRTIGTSEGLSVGFVQSILEDQSGFMWFATQDGLNRYDGYEMKLFQHNPKDKNSISSNNISSLIQDKNGKFWIGTNGGGLDMYDGLSEKFTHFSFSETDPFSISNDYINCIFQDSKGDLWIGTQQGLDRMDYSTKKFTRYLYTSTDKHSISNDYIKSICEDASGNIWVGTYGGGLGQFDRSKNYFNTYNLSTNKHDRRNLINCLKFNQGLLYIGTDDGIVIFNPDKKEISGEFTFAETGQIVAQKMNHISSITFDDKNELWIGTFGGGIIHVFDKNRDPEFIQVNEENPTSIKSNEIFQILFDRQKNMWVATQSGGVNVSFAYLNKFLHFKRNPKSSNTLPDNKVHALFVDHTNNWWIGTINGGLTKYNPKSKRFENHNQIFKKYNYYSVLSIEEDTDEELWIGTYGMGVVKYNPFTKKAQYYLCDYFDGQYSGRTVIDILDTKNGFIWIGTYAEGLFAINKSSGEIVNYTFNQGLSSDNIYYLHQDKNGDLWIATEGGGVMRMKGAVPQKEPELEYFQKEDSESGLSSNTVNHIFEDGKGSMWFATSNGLDKMDLKTKQFTQYYERDGLPNAYVYCVIPDEKGNLWMTTNKGLSKFNPNEKNIEGSAFRNFDMNDGLQGNEFNLGAFFKDKYGNLYLGGENGFNVFHPEKIVDNPHKPNVYITNFKLFGKPVSLDTNITKKVYIELSYKDNFFSFDFVGLDFNMPSKNKYSFKMEGLNDEWSPPSTQRFANFTQMEGGDYVLKVRACNNDGLWNEVPAEIYIRINPPWWKTKWFYTLSIITILTGIVLFVRIRTASIKKENRILEQKVAERTFELEQKNRDILSSIEYAKRIQEAILPPKELIFSKLPEAFILYKPKDIVSGDFYWFGEKNGRKIFAVVDCTGHGVPGAFMSMIGHNLLNQIILENNFTEPGEILTQLHRGVQAALKQGVHEQVRTADGMDVALVSIATESREVKFAGAFRNLVVVDRERNVSKIDGNKFPIGGAQLDINRQFETHTLQLEKGFTIYMTSDGYADQFGGEKGKKFMVKRFHEFLASINEYSMKVQGEMLDENFESWKGSYEQVDDILVAGIRL